MDTTNHLSTLTILAIVVCLVAGGAPAQNVLNRIVSTQANTVGGGEIAFTDTDTGTVTTYPLPQGYVPGFLVAMDRNGDVWLDDNNSTWIRKFSSTGNLLATANHPYPPGYLVTDQAGNLIVGCRTYPSPLGALFQYSPAGQFMRWLDIGTLFLGITYNAGFGITKILVDRSGALWVSVYGANHDPVIRLNPNWTLAASFGLYTPGILLPDDQDGVWVGYNNTFALGPPMPGVPVTGWVHLSSSGSILSQYFGGSLPYPSSYGQSRVDGRQFQHTFGGIGSITPDRMYVHMPQNLGSQWYNPADDMVFPPLYLGAAEPIYQVGFTCQLDGSQRLWVLRNSTSNVGFPPASYTWFRASREPPYLNNWLVVPLGRLFLGFPFAPHHWFWTSFWGPATLHEYAMYTEPDGDLDLDGVPNQTELRAFTNPFVPFAQTVQLGAPFPPTPGSTFMIGYTIPEDVGLQYFAPFVLFPGMTSVGSGYNVPFLLSDPLVQESLQPTWPWITGTSGVLAPIGGTGGLGFAGQQIQIPPLPYLSGVMFSSCIVTRDPAGATPLKTVSPLYGFTIQ